MRIRFQTMFSLSMKSRHNLQISLHLVRFLLSKSSKISLALRGNSSNTCSIFDNFLPPDRTFLINPNIFIDTSRKCVSLFWNISRLPAISPALVWEEVKMLSCTLPSLPVSVPPLPPSLPARARAYPARFASECTATTVPNDSYRFWADSIH